MWTCPKCKQLYFGRGNGLCLCSDTQLEEVEEEMANTIRWAGNTERFAGQRSGTLLSAELQIVREMSPELVAHVGGETPRGSAILCIYRGERGIPFAELRNYGSAALLRLKKSIGQVFEIDIPVTETKQVELDYGALDNHSDIQAQSPVAQEVQQATRHDAPTANRQVAAGVHTEAAAGVLPVVTGPEEN